MSAETLRRAAEQLRVDARVAYDRHHISKRECDFKFAVADWLDQATQAHFHGINGPVYVEDPRALAVAHAYLAE